ncbi:MAG: hypothetical protein ACKVJA_06165 [Flavobacteriales bacterium]
MDHEITEWFHSQAPPTHPYTKKCLTAFAFWGYEIKTTQYKIFDMDTNIATAIDVIVSDKEGKCCLLEIKTGFDSYHTKSTHFLESPLENIPNHALNQHFLQLLCCSVILEKHYQMNCIERCFVICIGEKGVTRHKLPPWAEKKRKGVYDRLIKKQQQKHTHDTMRSETLLRKGFEIRTDDEEEEEEQGG